MITCLNDSDDDDDDEEEEEEEEQEDAADDGSRDNNKDYDDTDDIKLMQIMMMKMMMKHIQTLSCWYPLDSSHWALLDEYPYARGSVIFKVFATFCINRIYKQYKGLRVNACIPVGQVGT